MGQEQDDAWHLDKRVPLGLMIAIIIQTITLVYVGTTWKAGIDNRLQNLEDSNVASRVNADKIGLNGTRITILEQQFISIQATLKRIEDKLDRKDATP